MKKREWILAFVIFVICIVTGFLYTFHPKTEPQEQDTAGVNVNMMQTARQDAKIKKDTKMVYQYYYTEDCITKEQEEQAQEFLLGLTKAQVESIYDGWQMVYFSPKRVILRSTIEGRSDENYLLGIHNGYLAVFRENEENKISLEEQTDIPISSLPEGEIQQLKEGMRILGENNLAKVLADYKS